MDTFGERLKAAMVAAGKETPEELSKLCGVSVRTADRYMRLEKADLSADIAYRIARGLNVRMAWLVGGETPVPFNEDVTTAFDLLANMSGPQAKRWLRIGRRMVDTGT